MMIGPMFGKLEEGALVLGFRCTPRHVNGRGMCHGGMMASLADQAVYAVRVDGEVIDQALVTVSLTVEFLRPIEQGAWVEVRTQSRQHGRRLHFAQMLGTVDDRPVFQASAVFSDAGPDMEGTPSLAAVFEAAP